MPHPECLHPNAFFDGLVRGRHSVRAYLSTEVPSEVVRELLISARLAPSSSNLQPGRFTLIQGALRAKLSDELVHAWRTGRQEDAAKAHFPTSLPSGLKKRRIASAQALYGALGVARSDQAGRVEQFEHNFRFFDAPVALIVSVEPGLGHSGFLDLGMTIYGLMLAARARGLDTCAIGALASFPSVIRTCLGMDDESIAVCGLALGYADPRASANQCRTERCALEEYLQVLG